MQFVKTAQRIARTISAAPGLNPAGALFVAAETLEALREKLGNAGQRAPELERVCDAIARGILRRFDAAQRQRRPAAVS